MNPTIRGLNLSLRVDVTPPPPASVTAGATALVIVTVTNTGSSPVSNLEYTLTSYVPLYNPLGPPSPAVTSYGSYFNGWFYSLGPGQKVIFRIGIQTTSGGLYPVFAAPSSSIFYNYLTPTGSLFPAEPVQISASSATLITATGPSPPL